MGWFNYYGLAVMAIIMIPNIIYAVKRKNDAANVYDSKAVTIAEQIGRYGCFFLMVFNIPYTYFGFWFDHALTVYLSVCGALCFMYIAFWIVCFNRKDLLRAVSLSVIPTLIFLFCGIMLSNIPLSAFSLLFGVTHIFISVKNVTVKRRKKPVTVEEKLKDEVLLLFVLLLLALAAVGVLFGADIGNGAFPL